MRRHGSRCCGTEGPRRKKADPSSRDRSPRKKAAGFGMKHGSLGAAWRGGGVGGHARLVEGEDAGTEGEEHDGNAAANAETGDKRSRAVVTTPRNDVTRNGDQELQHGTFQKPGNGSRKGILHC